MKRLLIVFAALLLFAAPASHVARAAKDSAQVEVMDSGTPIGGQHVTVIASDGKYEGVTDANGQYNVAIGGKYFRLVVNDTPVDGLFTVTQGVVRVDLSNL